MKTIWIYLLAAFIFVACSDDENDIDLTPTDSGTVVDSDGNEYGWVRIGGLDWTTSNARNGAPVWEEEYYDSNYGWYEDVEFDADEEEYFEIYGNLLSYEEALQSAPEGWRLPTDEDWKALERALGMGDDVNNTGWRGDIADDLFRMDGAPDINLRLGGSVFLTSMTYGLSVMLKYDGEAAYYWTATVDEESADTEMVYYRKLIPGQKGVERQSCTSPLRYMSVRWVRDAK